MGRVIDRHPDAAGPRPSAPPPGRCPSCRGARLTHLTDIVTPVSMSVLLPTRDEALAYPRATVSLSLCEDCGLITNTAFDAPAHDYAASYGETQSFSPRFLAYADELIRRLDDRYALAGRDVLEIGCARGDLLLRLVQTTGARGSGVDPSIHDEHAEAAAQEGVRLRKAFFDETDVQAHVSLVLCRHTLEHVHDVHELLERLHRALAVAPSAAVVIEVPDTLRILREGAFWDVFYEHCSYFTPGSLARACRVVGLTPTALELVYDGQYILLTASREGEACGPLEGEEPVAAVREAATAFVERLGEARAAWRERLAGAKAAGRTTVVWGAGAKGVAFLTALGVESEVACAVDVNPEKHGMFMPGTGHEIVAPAHLTAIRPDLVIVMNPIYLDEIAADLRALGLTAETVAV